MNNLKMTLVLGGVEFNLQLCLIIVLSTILPMLDWYGYSPAKWFLSSIGVTGLSHLKAYDRFIFYFVIPMLVIGLLWRDAPAAYGFKIGRWPEGLLWVLFCCGVMSLILWFAARTPAMDSYYKARAPENPLFLVYIIGLDLWSWEFIWRGFMLFGLARLIGVGPAIMVQAIPFAFMHLGKPELETFTTIFGGAFFGWLAWRTDSFLYPFFIHWYIASFTHLIARGFF
jgi:membrane protease YdiL (CAAX protease family)